MAKIALCAENMKLADRAFVAVVAQDRHRFISKFVGHRRVLDLRVKLTVLMCHVAEAFKAERALVLVLGELLETLSVKSVTTFQENTLLC